MSEYDITKTLVSGENNTTSLAHFDQYVAELKQRVKRQYDRGVNRDLSRQNWRDLFKRNITAVLKQAYEDSVIQLQSMDFDPERAELENGFSSLAVQTLTPFNGFIEDLMQYALQKHRTSCALSNFPEEHQPSEDYVAEVIQETARDWQAFALQVNNIVRADASKAGD